MHGRLVQPPQDVGHEQAKQMVPSPGVETGALLDPVETIVPSLGVEAEGFGQVCPVDTFAEGLEHLELRYQRTWAQPEGAAECGADVLHSPAKGGALKGQDGG